ADNLRRSLAATKRSGSLGRGLARIEATGRDTLIAFAAAPGQEAADGSDRNSPFTAALLKHLPQPGLEVSVILKEVAAEVRRVSPLTRHPILHRQHASRRLPPTTLRPYPTQHSLKVRLCRKSRASLPNPTAQRSPPPSSSNRPGSAATRAGRTGRGKG